MKAVLNLWLLLVFLLSPGLCLNAAETAPLKLKQVIPLPNISGRFDHFAFDSQNNRLFLAALGNDTLEILDVAAAKRLHSIPGLHKPQGVAFLPESNRIIVGNGSDGTCKSFAGTDYQLIKSIGGMDDADNVRYEPKSKLIYQGWGDGALAVIDSSLNRVVDIKLAGHPESFQLESAGPRLFVNVPDERQIVVVDRDRRSVIATWPMKKYQANFPMALDETNHRLFVGCRQPARLVILDTGDGHEIAALPISRDTDDLFYDAAHRRIYISCGEGFIDVIAQREGGNYQALEKIPTASGARTCYFSPERNELYLAAPARLGRTAEIRIYEALP